MFVIPIPIGSRHKVILQGTFWKLVACEKCRQMYAYELNLEAQGENVDLLFLNPKDSVAMARSRAERNLAAQKRNCILPVPCPYCGTYQADMVRKLKDDFSINKAQILGAIVFALSFLPLLFDIEHDWLFVGLGATFGASILAYGYHLAFNYEPNEGDPEARIALGQVISVWGEPLADVPLELADEVVTGSKVKETAVRESNFD